MTIAKEWNIPIVDMKWLTEIAESGRLESYPAVETEVQIRAGSVDIGEGAANQADARTEDGGWIDYNAL